MPSGPAAQLVVDATGLVPFGAEHVEAAERADLVAFDLAVFLEARQQLGADVVREIERRVMLSIIDQRWREHLYEMDYLQEGINLRAMGQKDPLVEWQRDGYAMFTAMMTSIAEDFVKYVMHLDVVVDAGDSAVGNMQYSGPDDPIQDGGGMIQAAARQAQEVGDPELAAQLPEEEVVQEPVVKTEHEKLGRNQPCWCGSGKKFKLCHGK